MSNRDEQRLMAVIAITGGTGFVGSHAIDRLLATGNEVRALARRAQPARDGVTWVSGALDQPDALAALVAGADAVLHVAGVINAPDRSGFAEGNIAGTDAVVGAARRAEVRRFVHVSSLAAREPALSLYGWSKAEAERVITVSGLDWTIVRPPTIFGPRDTEVLELFRMAKRRVVPLPPAGGRTSVIAVEELARLLVDLAGNDALIGEIIEPDDGVPGGWDLRDFAAALGDAVGKRTLPLPLPRLALTAIAELDRALRGRNAKLTPDRVAYFCHRDWASHLLPPADLWRSEESTPAALARTAEWYRAQGLL